ncbi:hypothetical protein BYT27DRAFT_7192390 [Phlegmacium glaucopus]|nr:hypothetical protein BYT27DRAFT_7192390 [Phlegmacium glaucopus]
MSLSLNLSRFAVQNLHNLSSENNLNHSRLCVIAHGPIPDITSKLGKVTYILTHERPINIMV